MPDLPTGTITFFFTDVEGSTRLAELEPAAMREALRRHDQLLAAGLEGYGGVVVKNRGEGDSFFAVFERATEAVEAAGVLQLALQAEPWPTSIPLRVRMALHSGEAELRQGDYYGSAVNRCARLRTAAHGGQVLLSSVTADVVRATLPATIGLRDLGSHRLRDLSHEERIYQLLHADLWAEFPPLRTLNHHPNNLPFQTTALIGRESEVAQARERLERPDVRLLVLTGPGGIGKTRLALQLAADLIDRYEDGVFFVPLGSIRDPALVLPAIVDTLDLQQVTGRSPLDILKDSLRARRVLLLLDNFEQVAEAVQPLSELLAACQKLDLVVTSRAVLGAYGELDLPIPPLTLPASGQLFPSQAVEQSAAVRLFVERAQAVKPDFALSPENTPTVIEICQRLEGLPLAIELAAARMRLLPPTAILARLDHRLSLLSGGARDRPARQQTLRDAMAWSYDLLDEHERMLFRQLSAFVGGFSLEAAEAVCGPGVRDWGLGAGGGNASGTSPDSQPPSPNPPPLTPNVLEGVASLVDKSLLRQVEVGGEPRFRMLQTIREFGLEQLEASGEAPYVYWRHAEHFLKLVEGAEPRIRAAEQLTWLERLEAEDGNLRAALAWMLADQPSDAVVPPAAERVEASLRLVDALIWFWYFRARILEGRDALARALQARELAVGSASRGSLSSGGRSGKGRSAAPLRAIALTGSGLLAQTLGDYAHASELCKQALQEAEKGQDQTAVARALACLGLIILYQGDQDEAATLIEKALAIFRGLGDRWYVAWLLGLLGRAELERTDSSRARICLEESLALLREIGDRWGLALTLCYLGRLAYAEAEPQRAAELLEESLALARQGRFRRVISFVLDYLAPVVRTLGDARRASELYRESLLLRQELADKLGIAECLEGFAGIARERGDPQRAARLFAAAQAMRQEIGAPLEPPPRSILDQELAPTRSDLPAASLARAWSAGRAMPADQAVSFALETPLPAGPGRTARRRRPTARQPVPAH